MIIANVGGRIQSSEIVLRTSNFKIRHLCTGKLKQN